MANAKIPPELQASVLKLADEGKDSEEISGWLWREHKIEVSSRAVRRLIRRRRTELADVAKSVVREEIRKHLLAAVRRIERGAVTAAKMKRGARARARALRDEAHDGHPQHPQALKEEALALKALDREFKAANLLMHYAGLNQPDQAGQPGMIDVNAARQALLRRIEALAEKPLNDPPTEPPVH